MTDKMSYSDTFQGNWLTRNKENVAESIVIKIRENHLKTAPWFPKIKIESVKVVSKNTSNETTDDIRSVLEIVSEKLVPTSSTRPVWSVEVQLEFKEKNEEYSSFETAAFMTYGILCWGVALLVCPMSGDGDIVVLHTIVTTDGGEKIPIDAYGGVRIVMTSPLAADNSELWEPAKAKALAASLGDFSMKLVEEAEERRPL